jgi:hypothetical protein
MDDESDLFSTFHFCNHSTSIFNLFFSSSKSRNKILIWVHTLQCLHFNFFNSFIVHCHYWINFHLYTQQKSFHCASFGCKCFFSKNISKNVLSLFLLFVGRFFWGSLDAALFYGALASDSSSETRWAMFIQFLLVEIFFDSFF